MLHSWKFAANAVWEKAFSVEAHQPIDIAAVEEWVAQNPQNIAFEAIFAENGVPATMFGIRITCLPKQDQIQRVGRMLLKSGMIKTEADFQKLANEIFPEYTLFSGTSEALNIGIVSQWYSFRPETIWNKTINTLLTYDDLKAQAPRFFEPTPNPAAIEFWRTDPIDHWYKIYVSDQQGDGYLINRTKYDSAITALTETRP